MTKLSVYASIMLLEKFSNKTMKNSCTCAPISPIKYDFDIHDRRITYIHRTTSTYETKT